MTITYAADIRPLFRERDLACMSPHDVQLDQVDWMCDAAAQHGYDDHGNARLVQKRLVAGDMPPDAPWSAVHLATFQKWMDDGFRP